MSDSDDSSVVRQVREAEAAMAERPSPRVRQAVLRAAAEAVGKDARGAGRRKPPKASGWMPRNWRWSLPVAASVVVGAIAFSVVSQVQRSERPTVVASAVLEQKPTPAPAPAPDQQARSDAAAPAADGAAANVSKAREIAPMAKVERPAVAQNAPAGSLAVAPVAAEAPAPQRRAEAAGEPLDAGGIEAAKKQFGSVQTRQRDQLAAGGRESERLDARSESAPAASAPPAAAAAPMPSARSAQSLAKAVDFHQTPQQWIDHIVALRRNGRQDEADRELALLRKRYPDLVIPPAALRPPE